MLKEYGSLKYEVENNKVIILDCDKDTSGTLNIPRTIEGKYVTIISSEAFATCRLLTKIIIPDTVVELRLGAFFQCESLVEINLPNSIINIGSEAFCNCTLLTSITIPDSVTSIDYRAFSGCISLKNIAIGSAVTSIGEDAFYNTAYYNDRSNWDNNVLYIGNYLISGRYKKYNKETDRYDIFAVSGDYSVKPGTKVIADGAFDDCTSLENVIIPDNVVSIGALAFGHCTSLKSINIPNSVTRISPWVFDDCVSLKSITIPDGITRIGASSFRGCKSLTSITIPDSVKSIGDYAFLGCSSLKNIAISDNIISVGVDAFFNTAYYNNVANWENNVLYIGNCLISGKLAKSDEKTFNVDIIFEVSGDYSIKKGTKVIAASAFSGCETVENITMPDSVTSIGNFAFEDCSSLKKIEGQFNNFPPRLDFLNLLEKLNEEYCNKN